MMILIKIECLIQPASLLPRTAQLILSAFTHLQFQVAVDSRLVQQFIDLAEQVKPESWLLRMVRGCLIGPQHFQWKQTVTSLKQMCRQRST